MAKPKDQESQNQPSFNIIPRDIGAEMRASYIDYAMSVIVGRALPDVRDGLKPVHRRILYTMDEMGLRHNKPFRKCAKIVGEVLGKYHPHGDSAVYDSLVRMAQDFSLLAPLVDGQGNFGSIDGDPPAAYRYTEARLKAVTNELLADIDKETVDWVPTYDNSSVEPTVLPAKLPNLLLNGSTGIAVGMATNIPPHSLTEICDAVMAYIQDPAIKTAEILKIMKGPDFPTGGIVRGRAGIKSYFETGRGSVRIQAKTDIEQVKGGRDAIIITELPYMVNKAKLIENIAELVRDKKVPDISDIRDESDRRGMRVVIEIKRDGNANVVLNQLWKHTQMESTFGVIMLALVDGRPRVLPMRDMLKAYVAHRKDVVTRRTQYILKKALERAHILEGFLIALNNIDKVIKIIRASSNAQEAKATLVKSFKDMTLVQAQAILDMRLHQLTRLSVKDIEEEYKELQKRIAECREILGDMKKVLKIIVDEIGEIKANYGEKRRTQITAESAETSVEDLITEEEVVVSISNQGYVKRTPSATYRSQSRGGKGVKGMTTKDDDFIEHLHITSSHATFLFFTSKGRVFALRAFEIPESSRSAKGKAIINLIALQKEERVTSAIAIRSFEDATTKDKFLFMATRKGVVKKTPLSDFQHIRRSGINAIALEEGDVLVEVRMTTGKDQVIMGTASGMCIRYSENDVRPMGRTAKGVKGIRLAPKDRVIGLEVADPKTPESLLTVCRHGYGKRTDLSEYRGQKRGGGGIITIKASERNGEVVGIKLVTNFDDLMVMTEKGMTVRLHCKDIKVISRNTQGVRLVRVADGDKVARVALVADDTYHGPEGKEDE